MGKRTDERLPPPEIEQQGPFDDDYDGQRFFQGLMWAIGFSAAGLAVAWLVIQIIGRHHHG